MQAATIETRPQPGGRREVNFTHPSFPKSHQTPFTRRLRIVGWWTDSTLETGLVSKALERAVAARGRTPGLIHHSDRGCQYASNQFREALASLAITASMSRKANCYDNATMESFWASLKTEVFDGAIALTRRQAEILTFDYIETFYNPRRLHSSLEYKSPIEFENDFKNKQIPHKHCPLLRRNIILVCLVVDFPTNRSA